MAKALLVKTRNGSWVTAKIAGIESTAKTRSLTSTMISTVSSGVAAHRPFSLIQNLAPCQVGVLGMIRAVSRSRGCCVGSAIRSRCRNICRPVTTRKTPNRYSTQWNRVISAAPAAMNAARMTRAPRTP